MLRRDPMRVTLQAAALVAAIALVPAAHAGIGDALKQKLKDKAQKKAEEAANKAAEANPKTPAEPAKPGEAKTDGEGAATAAAADTTTRLSAVSTKFDYVPGDKVVVFDDFTQDDVGEFPARWKPITGNFEVAESGDERWMRCVSPDGTVRLRLPEAPALPEYWTLEFDFYGTESIEGALTVKTLTADDNVVWEANFPHGRSMYFRSGDFTSDTPLEGSGAPEGRHHVMFMARGRGIKGYIDRERLVSMPEVDPSHGPAASLDIRLWATTKPMITNVRFAEGCKPAKDMLATGKFVTYGIRFATGSDVVLAESAPVLRDVAAWLKANPAAKLTVTGHTDNVGTAASNLNLSKRRAAAVARALQEQFGVAANRLATLGKGDTQAVADNAKPEGRAMNRRVEFAKL